MQFGWIRRRHAIHKSRKKKNSSYANDSSSNVKTPHIEIVKRLFARMQRAARVAVLFQPNNPLARGQPDLSFVFLPCNKLQSDETKRRRTS